MAETIGDWTPAELERYVKGLLLNDPSAVPKRVILPDEISVDESGVAITLSDKAKKKVYAPDGSSDFAFVGNAGLTTDASAGSNITALVTAICPVTLTLLGSRPVLVVWTGGALANASGISQNIQMRLYVAGAATGYTTLACFGNTPTIATGTTLQLTSACWLFPTGVGSGSKQFDMRFTVGDGSASVKYFGNSFSNPGGLSVIEL